MQSIELIETILRDFKGNSFSTSEISGEALMRDRSFPTSRVNQILNKLSSEGKVTKYPPPRRGGQNLWSVRL